MYLLRYIHYNVVVFDCYSIHIDLLFLIYTTGMTLLKVCVCVCVCMYIYIHTHTHTHTKGVLISP